MGTSILAPVFMEPRDSYSSNFCEGAEADLLLYIKFGLVGEANMHSDVFSAAIFKANTHCDVCIYDT